MSSSGVATLDKSLQAVSSSSSEEVLSWGMYPRVRPRAVHNVYWADELPELLASAAPGSLLPYGLGRSYGDSCLNEGLDLVRCVRMDRILEFDTDRGTLVCESGVTLSDILKICVPKGWFLSVTPGTRFVTIGGAIANDVHGKNHHRAGTFGSHVCKIGLYRSDVGYLECSPERNSQWFRAAIGGLGITGIIAWAEIQLRPILGPNIDAESVPFRSLEEFLALCDESDEKCEYTVAWIDAFSGRDARGIFFRGNHSSEPGRPPALTNGLSIPFPLPEWVLNSLSVRLFNRAYYSWRALRARKSVISFEPFFYPLDSISRWNLVYGRCGFLQYQCVIPNDQSSALQELLEIIRKAGMASFLGVLKRFGARPSPGILSFPRPGLTLALDFPMRGERTLKLMDALDHVVRESRGAVYPAKDARMSPDMFKASFPNWQDLRDVIDPALSSSFWRRMTEGH